MKKTAISLGNLCVSAQYAVRKGLRQTKDEGYKTCPFDIMTTNIDGIIDCIDTDFKFFCDPQFLLKDSKKDPNVFMVRNTKYTFTFNHESSPLYERYKDGWTGGIHHFTNNNFEKLIERYGKRIENFNYYCGSGDYYVTFIVQFKKEEYTKDKLDRLNHSLQTKYPSLDYTIKILPNNLNAN